MTPHNVAIVRSKIGERRIVASISGGKDSAALSLYLTELGIEHDRVFMDTGWEHNATYDYLRGELTRVIGPITEISGDKQMEDLIRSKGMFPSRVRRFCTQELKVFPMQRHLKALMDAGGDVINAVGIRHAESGARSKMPEWEWSDGFDCETWRPLVSWSEQEVIDIHRRHGLLPNPLYLLGATRVGCWPCIYARKAEVRLVAEIDPSRIDRLRALEGEVGTAARARAASRGEELKSDPTWFQARLGREGTWPIDRVVEWSKTKHGGKEFEPFTADARDQGCMRWGLCETNDATKGGEP